MNEPGHSDESDTLLRQFGRFLRQNKAWWLAPLVVVVIVFVVLIFVSGTSTTPFIYTAH